MNKFDYDFDLKTAFGFFGYQYNNGYRVLDNGTLLRIKDHGANFAYFIEDIEDNELVKKIVSVNYTDSDCKNSISTKLDEMKSEYPNIEIFEISFDWENTELNDAIELIKKHI